MESEKNTKYPDLVLVKHASSITQKKDKVKLLTETLLLMR
jgi:hypothetical protein